MSDEKYGFLDEEVADEVVPETVAEVPETVVTPEPPAPVVPTTTEPQEATHVPLAALKAEREKRQQYERELAAYRLQQQQPPQEVPGFYEAPEQHVQHVTQQLHAHMTQRMFAGFEEHARETHADYDEVLAEVQEHAQANPYVIQQVFNAANPAMYAYKLGKQLRAQKELADPQAYRAKVEAEIRAQIKAEQEAAEKQRAAQLAAIPPDLSAARSSRDQEIAEDDSLDSILASRKTR